MHLFLLWMERYLSTRKSEAAIFEDTQNPTGHDSEQSAVADPALGGGLD